MFGIDDLAIAALATSAISGAGNFFGGQAANATNAKNAAAANQLTYGMFQEDKAFQQDMAWQNRDFQREMFNAGVGSSLNAMREAQNFNLYTSGSQYQRAMEDMRKAGLNPMLAYAQGGAATAPTAAPSFSGSSSGGGSASLGHGGAISAKAENVLGPAVSSALQGSKVVPEIRAIQQETSTSKAQEALNGASAEAAKSRSVESLSNTAVNLQARETEAARTDLVRAQTISEGGVPAVQSSTMGLQGAQAAESGTRSDMNRQEVGRFDSYGPRGAVPDGLASAEAIARRAGRAAGTIASENLQGGSHAPIVPGGGSAAGHLSRSVREALSRLSGHLGRNRGSVTSQPGM